MHAGEPEKRQRMQARDNMGENNSNQGKSTILPQNNGCNIRRVACCFCKHLSMDHVKAFLILFRICIMTCMKGMS